MISETSRREITEAAKEIWRNRLEMAEPKYCANGSWGHYHNGFTLGVEWATQTSRKEVEMLQNQIKYLEEKWDEYFPETK